MKLIELLNWFRERHLYERFLEINIKDSKVFNAVTCRVKDCTGETMENPTKARHYYKMSQESFFRYNVGQYDMILLNGCDNMRLNCAINKCLKIKSNYGIVIVHPYFDDTPEEHHPTAGEPWQAIAYQRTFNHDIFIRTMFDAEEAFCIIQSGREEKYRGPMADREDLNKNMEEIFRPIEKDELVKYY